MSHNDTKEVCGFCGKEFILRIIRYPSNADDRRESFVDCPYCGKVLRSIRLDKNEDSVSLKIEE